MNTSTETSIKECPVMSSFDSRLPAIEQTSLDSQQPQNKHLKLFAGPPSRAALSPCIPSIDVTYSLVYTDIAKSDPDDADWNSQIHIIGEQFAEDNGFHICTVYMRFRNFSCELTCLYHPSSGTLSAFEVEDRTMSGEIEDEAIAVEDIVIVAMQRRKKVKDEYVGEEVKDDNGNPFLFAFMDFGYSGRYPFVGRLYGKMVKLGENVGDVSLSEEEKARLNIDRDEVEA